MAQGTTVPEAHAAYRRGRYFWNQRNEEGFRAAIQEFDRAILLDSTYAEAWSGLADSNILLSLSRYSPVDDPRAWATIGVDAGRQAVSLAPNLGVAHTSLGMGLFLLGD